MESGSSVVSDLYNLRKHCKYVISKYLEFLLLAIHKPQSSGGISVFVFSLAFTLFWLLFMF